MGQSIPNLRKMPRFRFFLDRWCIPDCSEFGPSLAAPRLPFSNFHQIVSLNDGEKLVLPEPGRTPPAPLRRCAYCWNPSNLNRCESCGSREFTLPVLTKEPWRDLQVAIQLIGCGLRSKDDVIAAFHHPVQGGL